jgi:hypothetical protein
MALALSPCTSIPPDRMIPASLKLYTGTTASHAKFAYKEPHGTGRAYNMP